MSNMEMSGRQMSDRQMSQMGMSAKQYSGMDRQMSMYNNDQTNKHGMDRQMNMGMDRHMSGMRMGMDRQMSMYNNDQAFGVDQYYNRDDFGNYAYGYANGNSEEYEVGNPQGGVKGYYTYVDSNNLNRRVEYIADDQGFRIIKEDGERFKREAEAQHDEDEDLLPGLVHDGRRHVPDGEGHAQERHVHERRMFDRQMFDRDMSRDNMQMYRNVDMMQDRDMMNMRQMSDRQMSPNMMSNNRFFDMYDMSMPQMRMDDGILGERNTMSQRMEIERIPDNRVSYMLF